MTILEFSEAVDRILRTGGALSDCVSDLSGFCGTIADQQRTDSHLLLRELASASTDGRSYVICRGTHHDVYVDIFYRSTEGRILQGLDSDILLRNISEQPAFLKCYTQPECDGNGARLVGPYYQILDTEVLSLHAGKDIVSLAKSNRFPMAWIRVCGTRTRSDIPQYDRDTLTFRCIAAADRGIARKLRLLRVVSELQLTKCIPQVNDLTRDECEIVAKFAEQVASILLDRSEMHRAPEKQVSY